MGARATKAKLLKDGFVQYLLVLIPLPAGQGGIIEVSLTDDEFYDDPTTRQVPVQGMVTMERFRTYEDAKEQYNNSAL